MCAVVCGVCCHLHVPVFTQVLLEPWFSPRPLTRVWCLYEILLSILAGKRLTVLSPPQEKAALSAALEKEAGKPQPKAGRPASVELGAAEDKENRFQQVRAPAQLFATDSFM